VLPEPTTRCVLRAVLLVAAVLPSGAPVVHCQTRASERGKVSQVISGTEIEVEYYRPSARGRSPVFGGIVRWGEVWTPGANFATTLRVSRNVALNGVTLPAGKYGLWMQVLEEGPWTLVVHPDTLRGHGNHPGLEEGVVLVPLEPVESPAFEETLTFTIGHLRATSAELRLEWGTVRVPIELGIDLGVEVALAPDEANALAGEWMYDDTPNLPSPEEVEERMAMAEARGRGERSRRVYEALFALARPRPVLFEWDPRNRTVSFTDALQDAMWASMGVEEEDQDGDPNDGAWSRILIPRGGGNYALASAVNGELASYDPSGGLLIEFEFDAGGRPVRFTLRDGRDEIIGSAVRPSDEHHDSARHPQG